MKDILVIDDEQDVRDAIKRVLDRAGYAVRSVESAEDALERLSTNPADLVITDIIMPKVDGVKAIQAIRSRFPAIRILAISGGGNFEIGGYQPGAITTTAYLAAAQKAGAHLTLTKPFESAELLRAVEAALQQSSH